MQVRSLAHHIDDSLKNKATHSAREKAVAASALLMPGQARYKELASSCIRWISFNDISCARRNGAVQHCHLSIRIVVRLGRFPFRLPEKAGETSRKAYDKVLLKAVKTAAGAGAHRRATSRGSGPEPS